MGDYTVVGIDFGTSTTVVKMRNYEKDGTILSDWKDLQFGDSNKLPTVAYKNEKGQFYFGQDALNKEGDDREEEREGTPYKNFKMKLASKSLEEVEEGKKITEEFFKYIYSSFNAVRADKGVLAEVRTYVSYPVKWTSEIMNFMKECAEKAGFTNVNPGNEPTDEATAAIYASIPKNLENLQKERVIIRDMPVNVMMLDMGAGTSDISIFSFKIGADNKLVPGNSANWPPIDKQTCGGSEIDKYLAEELGKYFAKLSKKGPISKFISEEIEGSAKGWKETPLSPKLKEGGSVGLPERLGRTVREKQHDGIYEDLPFDRIDRQRFEAITGEHWRQLRELIAGALSNATGVLSDFTGAGDIDLIILTGGHSMWYGVREFILGKDFAGCEPIDFEKIKKNPDVRLLQEPSPQETVALGLVKMDEYKKNGLDLKPAMANSVWIQYKLENDTSEPKLIIERNLVLPFETKDEYTFEVQKSVFSIGKKVHLGIRCYYGTDLSTAKFSQIDLDKRLEYLLDEFIGFILGVVLGPIFGTKAYFSVTIKLSISVNKNGTIDLNGKIQCADTFSKKFTLKI